MIGQYKLVHTDDKVSIEIITITENVIVIVL
jgi:hypothetical protein